MTKSIPNAFIALFVSLICVLFPHLVAKSLKENSALTPAPEEIACPDRIHFLKTDSSDAILLESDGHFAMVDAGEDTDNPRGFEGLNLPGHEQEVLAYLKAHAADETGRVHLDFVLGTHAHSDHIGGFDTVILDPDVTVDRAYLKEYDSTKIHNSEVVDWDNQEVYDQMVNALNERGVPIVSHPDGTPFALGNFTITLFNTEDPYNENTVGENDNSLGVLVEKNGTRVFLAGDMDNYNGDEERLAPEIGRVDLLKVGHHSYSGSSTAPFIRTLRPKAFVVTNNGPSADGNTIARLVRICRHRNVYFTGNENGVLAVIGDNGNIDYYGGICG